MIALATCGIQCRESGGAMVELLPLYNFVYNHIAFTKRGGVQSKIQHKDDNAIDGKEGRCISLYLDL